MQVKPIPYYKEPAYPQKSQVEVDPGLLHCIPSRWKKNLYVMTALGMTFGITACTSPLPNSKEYAPAGEDQQARIFIHGKGFDIASYGCLAVAAPSYITEAEALDIIRTEALSYGNLELNDAQPMRLNDIPFRYSLFSQENGRWETQKKLNLNTDASNTAENVSIEFISQEDIDNWHLYQEDNTNTAGNQTYEFQKTAAKLQNGINKTDTDQYIGIFYDPVDNENNEEYYSQEDSPVKANIIGLDDVPGEETDEKKSAHPVSEEELRAQVRDFIDWLKGQGVI